MILAAPRSRAIGFGAMRLSREAVDEARAIATIHAALNAGATFIDTADVYAPTPDELGHNERLIARALSIWHGDRGKVLVSTKGGLRRDGSRWWNDGRARHLNEACEASLSALGRSKIDLYFLHAPDPRTSLETSVRALASLRRDALVERIGLCNINVDQLERALAVAPIDAVQMKLDPLGDEAIRSGVAEACRAHGILLFAHSPLGGVRGRGRLAKDARLREVASRHGCSAEEIALAWSVDAGAIPLPGATQPDTARSSGRALHIDLDADDRARLPRTALRTNATRYGALDRAREVVLVIGGPGSGKSTVARELERTGYERLNRDERGGRLEALAEVLDARLAIGAKHVVLDNTYSTRSSRSSILEIAAKHGVAARCISMTTSIEHAQVNACVRMIRALSRLPSDHELAASSRDPIYFAPSAQLRHRRLFEAPRIEEGFDAIETREAPSPFSPGTRRAVIVAREALSSALAPALACRRQRGELLLGVGWMPGASREEVSEETKQLDLVSGVALAWRFCTHPAGPPRCWCRPPLPGFGVEWILRHELDALRSTYVGVSAADRALAERIGFRFIDPEAVSGE